MTEAPRAVHLRPRGAAPSTQRGGRWLGALLLAMAGGACAQSEDAFRAQLASEDGYTRFMAALALAAGDVEPAQAWVSELYVALLDPSERVRESARRMLLAKPRAALPQLLRELEIADRQPIGGRRHLMELARGFSPEDLAPLARALEHPQCEQHSALCAGLARLAPGPRFNLRAVVATRVPLRDWTLDIAAENAERAQAAALRLLNEDPSGALAERALARVQRLAKEPGAGDHGPGGLGEQALERARSALAWARLQVRSEPGGR